MKKTVKASSDVALIKYWGKKDEILRLPENGSVSMKLNGLDTVTTVEFRDDLFEDRVMIQGQSDVKESIRVVKHLNRIRKLANSSLFAQVESKNTFPKGTGLSSSGSGFAALTLAASLAIGLDLDEKELSILARQGSGTACRCVCGGFVEWLDGSTSNESYSHTIFNSEYWDIRDVVAIVDEGKKLVSSTEGHESARSSPFYESRLGNIKAKIASLKEALQRKDFTQLGSMVEAEALEFHSILLTSSPSLIAWYPGTIEVMHLVKRLRSEGVEAYFTINTGFNVHVLTLPENQSKVESKLKETDSVKQTLVATVGDKPSLEPTHLF